MDDFYKCVEHADARKINDVGRERAIRMYSTQRGESWALQVRAPMVLANGAEGRDFIVAHASLDEPTLRALHAAIGAHLKELDK